MCSDARTTLEPGYALTGEELLVAARDIAERCLTPCAAASDQAAGPSVENMSMLAATGLLGLSTPVAYGGAGASGAVRREYAEILAAACGVTGFVQGQHQSAASLIAGGSNEELKRRLLPELASGRTFGGVAFSHLRRPGAPILNVREVDGGYVFTGTAPWVTGWPLVKEIVLGGTLPDSTHLYVAASVEQTGTAQISEPMRLCAMNASGTVQITYSEHFVPEDRFVKRSTPQQMAAGDMTGVLGAVPQLMGVTRASIDLMRTMDRTRPRPPLTGVIDALSGEQRALRLRADALYDTGATIPEFCDLALTLRAHATHLAIRAAHAAFAAGGGGANSITHPAQRFAREAMFYALTMQTAGVQGATLDLHTATSLRALDDLTG